MFFSFWGEERSVLRVCLRLRFFHHVIMRLPLPAFSLASPPSPSLLLLLLLLFPFSFSVPLLLGGQQHVHAGLIGQQFSVQINSTDPKKIQGLLEVGLDKQEPTWSLVRER